MPTHFNASSKSLTISDNASEDSMGSVSTDASSLTPTPPRPRVVGICGASASGKTTLCTLVAKSCCKRTTAFIPADCFYRPLTGEDQQRAYKGQYDFDHPKAIDWKLMILAIQKATSGVGILVLPTYDFTTHSRVTGLEYIEDRTSEAAVKLLEERDSDASKGAQTGGGIIDCEDVSMIICEGILIFASDQELRDLMDLKIYVESDSDLRLALRIKRDVDERKRAVDNVLQQYLRFVKPSFEHFVDPSKLHADLIIPNNFDPYNPQTTGISDSALNIILISIRDSVKSFKRSKTLMKSQSMKPVVDAPIKSAQAVDPIQ